MSNSTPFNILIIYLFFEYARPSTFIPMINYLRPGIIIILLLIAILFKDGHLTDPEPLKKYPTKPFLLLIILMLIHIPIATNNYWALQIFKNTFFLFVIYLGIISYVDSSDKIQTFVFAWIVINTLCALNGIINGGMIPGSAFMGDENDFALVMNMTIPIAFFMFPAVDSRNKKIFLALSIVLCSMGSVLSLSRGGFIGLVTVGFYCWIKSTKKVASAIIIVVLVLVAVSFAPPTFLDEIKSITEENIESGTGHDRWYMWQRGWDMFLDNFFIGVGQGNYPYNVGNYEPEDISVYWYSHAGRVAHSLYITLISELGILGLILYYLMISSIYKGIGKRISTIDYKQSSSRDNKLSQASIKPHISCYKSTVKGMYGALCGYFVTGVFLSVLYYPHLYLVIAVLSAVKITMKNEEINSLNNDGIANQKIILEHFE